MPTVDAEQAAGAQPAGSSRAGIQPGDGVAAPGTGCVVDHGCELGHSSDPRSAEDFEADLSELVDNLHLVFARVQTLWKETAARVHPELQPATYKVLIRIARSDGVNAYHLAEVFETDKSVISRQVRILEHLGLVDSRPDEHDGRLRVLTATDAAHKALAEDRGKRAERLRDAVSRLSPEEIRAASRAFALLADS